MVAILQQQAAGDTTPESHIDQTIGAIEELNIDEVKKEALQDEVMKMETHVDAERLKQLIDGLKGLGS